MKALHGTLLCVALLLAANDGSAQVPRKKACDFLTQADISAASAGQWVPRAIPAITGCACMPRSQGP